MSNSELGSEVGRRPGATNGRTAPPADRVDVLERNQEALEQQRRKALRNAREYKDQVAALRRQARRLSSELEKVRAPPLIVGIVEDVLSDGRVVVKASTGPNFVVPVAEDVDRTSIAAGARAALAQNSLTLVSILPPSREAVVAAAEVIDRPQTRYANIGGLEATVEAVREAVEYPLTDPERYGRLGVKPPAGVLMIGPPGCGKTLLARAVAGETNATFMRVVASELVQKFIGEGSRKVREIFQLARERAPTLLFIDELDAIGARRTDEATASNREVERTLVQLLAELDGFDARGGVRLIGATNRADILDPALTRPGRFDRVIDVPLPDAAGRRRILEIHTADMRLAKDVSIPILAERAINATGADIQALCMEAGMVAVRRRGASVSGDDFDAALGRFRRRELPSQRTAPATMYS